MVLNCNVMIDQNSTFLELEVLRLKKRPLHVCHDKKNQNINKIPFAMLLLVKSHKVRMESLLLD